MCAYLYWSNKKTNLSVQLRCSSPGSLHLTLSEHVLRWHLHARIMFLRFANQMINNCLWFHALRHTWLNLCWGIEETRLWRCSWSCSFVCFWCLVRRSVSLSLIGPDVLGTVERRSVSCGHLHHYPGPPTHQLPSGNLYVKPADCFTILNLIVV